MSDIVERLRGDDGAAGEIERLEADNERLRAALREIVDDGLDDWDSVRIARAALEQKQ